MRSERLDASLLNPPAVFLLAAALALPAAAQATVGVTEIANKDGGPVTIFYSSSSEAQLLKRGPHVRGRAHGPEPGGRPLVAGAIQGSLRSAHRRGFLQLRRAIRGPSSNRPLHLRLITFRRQPCCWS